MIRSFAVATLVLGSSLALQVQAQTPALKPLAANAVDQLLGTEPSPVLTAPLPTAQQGWAGSATAVGAVAAYIAPKSQMSVLPAGSRLSDALDRYVSSQGWQLRWNIDEDYMLDAPLPIPSSSVIEGVTWVVQAYQSQGGMSGVVPRFARGNSVVVIESMNVRDPQ